MTSLAFNFTQISNSSDGFVAYRAPAINNDGTLAFEAFPAFNGSPTAILIGNGGATTTIFDSTDGPNLYFTPSINNAGTVAASSAQFLVPPQVSFPTLRSAIIKANSDGTNTQIVRDTIIPQFVAQPDINNRETIVYVGGNGLRPVPPPALSPLPPFSGIFTSDGRTIADSNGVFDDFDAGLDLGTRGTGTFNIFSLPSINDRETVAFRASLDSGERGIFTGKGDGNITTIADSSDRLDNFSSAVINNQGQVAFAASLDLNIGGGRGLYVGSETGLTTLFETRTSSLFDDIIGTPALNNLGNVAFLAKTDDGDTGIFFKGPDSDFQQVIAVGDVLSGSTLVDVFISRNGLNDSGQIAFTATFIDNFGSPFEQVFRAAPVSVPEFNSAIGLLAVAALGLLSYGMRRAKRDVPRGRA